MLDWTLAANRSASHRDPRTHFTIGTGCEPEALDLQREWERLAHKIDAGADYVMTQPTFDRKALAALTAYRAQVPIVVGVMVLRGLEHARRIAEVPGVVCRKRFLQGWPYMRTRPTKLKQASNWLPSKCVKSVRRAGAGCT